MSGISEALEAWRDVPSERVFSLWVLGERREAFEAGAPFVEAVQAAQGRLRVILTGPEALRGWLAERFPQAAVHRAPPAFGLAIRRFLSRANLRGVLALDDAGPEPAVLAAALAHGLPLIAARSSSSAPSARADVAREAALSLDLAATPVPEAVARLGATIARDHKLLRKSDSRRFTPSALALAATRGGLARTLVGWRLRRLDDAEALFEELGRPETILCLGNGPSSEDPRLKDLAYDALFRVNRSWAGRGFLTRPDMIFTASKSAMAEAGDAILGLRSEASELRLVRARTFDPRRGPARFARADLISAALTAYDWGPFRPTNGATMLAVAAALKPRRLVVAGIDMFSHPAGAYPGDAATPNAFAPAHDPQAERDFLLSLFEAYEGELVIVGEVLRAAWEARRAQGGGNRLPPGDDAA